MIKKNYLSIYAKSFNWAGFFLPKRTYQQCSSLYDFCRYVDNIADEQGYIEKKLIDLDNFQNRFNSRDTNDQIIKNIWEIIETYNISLKIINDLFDGVRSDLKTKVEINSKKDLLIYSYRVAGTVGLMMAKILKVNNKEALMGAVDLGIGMQLTNISRDVIEDSNNNRFYINNNFENIKDTLDLADKFYENSFKSIKEIPIRLRFAILVARRVYRKIGYKIIQTNNFETYKNSGKIFVNNFGKLIETFMSIYDLLKLYFITDKINLTENEHLLINEEIKLYERI
tara:strand:+ start:555 stop:1406 length:852 start_codon:yes stop_codon:yes gene_type:complete